ncbi:MAG: hypothetical protein ACFE0R_01410 [Salinarimonas sp.]
MIDYDVPSPDERIVEPAAVAARVDDWVGRLDALFADIRTWAEQHGWAAAETPSIPMREEMMERAGLPERRQPMLRLEAEGGRYAWFKPKALWVIGANGRIDLYTSAGIAVIVDVADAFDPPDWRIYRGPIKAEGQRFTPDLVPSLA